MRIARPATLAVATLLGLGLLASGLSSDLPIVRNAHIYAKTAYFLIDSDLDVGRVTKVRALSYGKPTFFPLLTVPFVARFGAQVGIPLGSALGTAGYLLAALAFFRRLGPRFGLGERELPLALALAFLNPLAVYQFWSGYPDSLFAAFFILSFVFLDRLVREGRARDAPLYVLATYLAVATKHYGLILLPLHALYAAFEREALAATARRQRRTVLLLAVCLLLFAIALGLATTGHNPTLRLGARSSGAATLWRSLLRLQPPILGHLGELATFLALGLSPLFPLALHPTNFRRELAVFACVPVAFAAPLFTTPGSFNLRYYLPIAPFVALFVCRGILAWRARLRGPVLALGFALSALLVGYFNFESVYRVLHPHAPAILAHRTLENLRMARHLRRRDAIREVNATEPRAQIHYVSRYYGNADHHVDERSGLFRPDLRIRYHRDPPAAPDVRPGHYYWIRDGGRRAVFASELEARGVALERRGVLLRVAEVPALSAE